MEITSEKEIQSFYEGATKAASNGKTFYGDLSKLPQHQIEEGAPYSYLAEDGIIDYNGVTFVCDKEKGSLVVNRDCVGSLMKAIGMFSPEDKVRIMKAVSLDNKIQEMKMEIDEDTNSIGNGTTNTADGGSEAASTITDIDGEPSKIDE